MGTVAHTISETLDALPPLPKRKDLDRLERQTADFVKHAVDDVKSRMDETVKSMDKQGHKLSREVRSLFKDIPLPVALGAGAGVALLTGGAILLAVRRSQAQRWDRVALRKLKSLW